jgi:hypothetical protein
MLKKTHLALYISLFEIVRWIMIYFFFVFVKSNFDAGLSGDNSVLVWMLSTFFSNLLFAASGILIYLSYENYHRFSWLWFAYKLFFVVLTLCAVLTGMITIQLFLALFIPVDFFLLILIGFLLKKEAARDNNQL